MGSEAHASGAKFKGMAKRHHNKDKYFNTKFKKLKWIQKPHDDYNVTVLNKDNQCHWFFFLSPTPTRLHTPHAVSDLPNPEHEKVEGQWRPAWALNHTSPTKGRRRCRVRGFRGRHQMRSTKLVLTLMRTQLYHRQRGDNRGNTNRLNIRWYGRLLTQKGSR